MKLPKFLNTIEGQFVTGIIVIIVILFGYYFYAAKNDSSLTPVNIEVNATDHVRGAVDAKVTLVEFGDFQCPACGAYEPIVEQIVEANKSDIKFVFRNFPLTQIHQNALLAAKSAEAAGLQGKFWEMHDMLYAKQQEWSESLSAADIIDTYAKGFGLDMTKFHNDIANTSIEDNILAQYKEGAKLGVEGTPTFFLDGKKLTNPRSAEEFDKIIKDEVAKVNEVNTAK